MKMLVGIVTSFVSLVSAGNALACSPEIWPYAQSHKLGRALNSEAYQNALSQQVAQEPGVSITNVKVLGATTFTLSNNCVIEVTESYKPSRTAGMCPELDRIEAETTCAD